MSEFPTQVTVKPPAQFSSAPWLNFQGQSPDEVKDQILEVFPGIEHDSFAELVAKAFQEYGAVLAVTLTDPGPNGAWGVLPAPQAGSIQSSGPAPQWAGPVAAAAPSGPPAPQCPHGERVKKSGVGKSGEWAAWMCAAGKGDPSKCKPIDAKTGQAWK